MEVVAPSLLLLDLDGVSITQDGPEFLYMHESLGPALTAFGLPVVVLTHRSRKEAEAILEWLEVRPLVAGVLAAEDILFAAATSGRWGKLLSKGLRKSHVLDLVERRYGVRRERVAFIDDRLDNLDDLFEAGVGYTVHAPTVVDAAAASMTTFRFAEVGEHLARWGFDPDHPRRVSVELTSSAIEPWRRTGRMMTHQGRHLFNVIRTMVRRLKRRRRRAVS